MEEIHDGSTGQEQQQHNMEEGLPPLPSLPDDMSQLPPQQPTESTPQPAQQESEQYSQKALSRAAMGRRLTARDLPRLADCEALFALAKVDAAPPNMSPELEELYRFIRQQEDDTSTGMEAMGYMSWSSKQVEQKVRELENLAYRLGLDEDVQVQRAHDYKIFG